MATEQKNIVNHWILDRVDLSTLTQVSSSLLLLLCSFAHSQLERVWRGLCQQGAMSHPTVLNRTKRDDDDDDDDNDGER